jgi:phosphoglycolate phosphatase
MKLLLFDIDGTLVLTGGAGARSMIYAFRDVFSPDPADGSRDERWLADTPMAGRTDTWIVGEMARRCDVECDAASIARFHDVYLGHLTTEIQRPGPRKEVLPGVRQTLDALAERDDVFLALLTGNFAAGARLKLEYFDLWRYFRCGAFAEDAPDRNSLFGQALARVKACGGPDVNPADVVVIGDTPLDVAVAIAGGGRAVGVATGSYTTDALVASGADVALRDLSDLTAVVEAFGLR